jgi:hypothetical protein
VYDVAGSYRKLQQDRVNNPLAGYDADQLADNMDEFRRKNEHKQTNN